MPEGMTPAEAAHLANWTPFALEAIQGSERAALAMLDEVAVKQRKLVRNAAIQWTVGVIVEVFGRLVPLEPTPTVTYPSKEVAETTQALMMAVSHEDFDGAVLLLDRTSARVQARVLFVLGRNLYTLQQRRPR